jgi:hypothetical protein
MANKKISDYTEALSVANDDFFEISVDAGGGSYLTRKVKKSNMGIGGSPLTTKGDVYTFDTADARLPVGTDGQALIADSAEATGLRWGAISADNMATADLTLTVARTHNLDGNILKFDTDEIGYIEVGNVAVTEGIKIYQQSNGVNYINGSDGNLLVGAEGNDNLSIKTDGTSQFNDNLKIGSGSIGGTAARLKVRGNSLTTGECFIFEDSGGREILRGSNNRQLYSRTLNITGLGATSATTALLVENSSSTEALKVLDDLAIIMANLPTSSAGLATGQLWNNSGVVNIV